MNYFLCVCSPRDGRTNAPIAGEATCQEFEVVVLMSRFLGGDQLNKFDGRRFPGSHELAMHELEQYSH